MGEHAKKIGLVSSYKVLNYGAVLQSLATVKFLQARSFDVECINYKKDKSIVQILRSLPLLLISDVRQMKMDSVKRKVYTKFFSGHLKKHFSLRKNCFEKFVKEHFVESKPIYGYSKLKEAGKKFDATIVGSDQVWHPINFGTHLNDLSWVADSIPKIAYASSFGVSEIPAIQKKTTRRYLNSLNNISTRENAGATIVKNLTGKDVPVVCDPSVLYDASFWNNFAIETKPCEGDYILCYFLGKSPEHRMLANTLKAKTGAKIISLPHVSSINKVDFDFGDVQDFAVGPGEFLGLIKNAAYVCTDSFHASVFSILYHRNFVVCNRYKAGHGSKNSRIDTLLKVAGLEARRKTSDFEDCSIFNVPIDYSLVDSKLESYRKESIDFFEKCLASIGNA